MNKLSKRQYIVLIAKTLTKSYGSTLVEYDTDIELAKAVVKKLAPYLFFHPIDMTDREWKSWKRSRIVP